MISGALDALVGLVPGVKRPVLDGLILGFDAPDAPLLVSSPGLSTQFSMASFSGSVPLAPLLVSSLGLSTQFSMVLFSALRRDEQKNWLKGPSDFVTVRVTPTEVWPERADTGRPYPRAARIFLEGDGLLRLRPGCVRRRSG